MADNKTKPTRKSVAAFIEALTDDSKRADAKALVKLMQSATGEKPKMWGPSIKVKQRLGGNAMRLNLPTPDLAVTGPSSQGDGGPWTRILK